MKIDRCVPAKKQLVYTTIKVRLYPTAEQAALFNKTFGCCRYLWNQMLADEREFYAATGTHFIPTPARYKKDAPFLKEVDSQALVTVHQNIQRAFRSFFSKPEQFGYPQFKRKKNGGNTFKVYCQYNKNDEPLNVFTTKEGVRFAKAEVVRARFHRRPLHWWKLKAATVSKTASGKYFCSLLYEYPEKEREARPIDPERVLGLNYSMRYLYVDSGGGRGDPPRALQKSEKKLAEMQRRLSRMERGSKNYDEQLQRIRLLHEHIANQRRDFLYKESRRIANACDAVCVRDANLREMARELKLGSVTDGGFGTFRYCLGYKLERQGKRLVVVDKYAPTAKTCHVCGDVNEELTLQDRVWRCPHCGATLRRGVNAAINIKNEGLAQLAQERKAKNGAA